MDISPIFLYFFTPLRGGNESNDFILFSPFKYHITYFTCILCPKRFFRISVFNSIYNFIYYCRNLRSKNNYQAHYWEYSPLKGRNNSIEWPCDDYSSENNNIYGLRQIYSSIASVSCDHAAFQDKNSNRSAQNHEANRNNMIEDHGYTNRDLVTHLYAKNQFIDQQNTISYMQSPSNYPGGCQFSQYSGSNLRMV